MRELRSVIYKLGHGCLISSAAQVRDERLGGIRLLPHVAMLLTCLAAVPYAIGRDCPASTFACGWNSTWLMTNNGLAGLTAGAMVSLDHNGPTDCSNRYWPIIDRASHAAGAPQSGVVLHVKPERYRVGRGQNRLLIRLTLVTIFESKPRSVWNYLPCQGK